MYLIVMAVLVTMTLYLILVIMTLYLIETKTPPETRNPSLLLVVYSCTSTDASSPGLIMRVTGPTRAVVARAVVAIARAVVARA